MAPSTRSLPAVLAALVAVLVASAPAAAAPPSIEEGRAQLARGEIDELFIAFASVKRGVHPAGDPAVAALLVDAAKVALSKNDPTLALGLADKARALDATNVAACLADADAAIALQQRGVAEDALDAAVRIAPKTWSIVLRRALFAEEEGELARALALFKSIPANDASAAEAKQHVAALTVEAQSREAALAETRRLEQEAASRQRGEATSASTADDGEPKRPGKQARNAMASDGETVAGMAARSTKHFRIVYNQRDRDFGERASYEQRVLDLFERAHERVTTRLGHVPDGVMDVVLYTRDEFQLHFGGQFTNSMAGFYSGKIRMNYAEKLDDDFYATAVHEYVHAVVDSLNGHRGAVPTWMNEGLARWLERSIAGGSYVNFDERQKLRIAAKANELAPLRLLASGSFGQLSSRQMYLAYWKSSCAIEALIASGGGLSKINRVIAGVEEGTFDAVFAREFGERRLAGLDDDVLRVIAK